MALAAWLEPFWMGMAQHLWQTGLFVGVLAVIALALRRSSARLLSVVYWTGMLKLALPLPLLGPVSERLLDGGPLTPGALSGEPGWATVFVVMYPAVLEHEAVGSSAIASLPFVLISAVWLLGTSLIALRRAAPHAASHGHPGVDLWNVETRTKLGEAIAAAGLQPDDVRVSADTPCPCVRGAWRPAIVLPQLVVEELETEELRGVLIHEREHLRRHDPLRYTALGALCAVFWFYPPVWWLARRIRETTEMACDEAVVRAGVPVATYCRSLARALRLGLGHRAGASILGILGHRASFFHYRLERINSSRRFETMLSHRVTAVATVFLALAASLLPLAPAALRAGEVSTDAGKELDGLADRDMPITLNYPQSRIGTIYDALAQATGIEFRLADGLDQDRRVDFELPKKPLWVVLTLLGQVAGTTHRVTGPHHVDVDPILLAGKADVTTPLLIKGSNVSPVYPQEARERRLAGKVILRAVVDRTGSVSDLQLLRSEPVDYEPFVTSALSAVRQWRYHPATRDGQPVDAYMTVVIQFDPRHDSKNEPGEAL